MDIPKKNAIFTRDGGGPSLDILLAHFDKELENFEQLVQPAPESKPRTPFDSPNVKAQKFSGMRPSQLPALVSTMLPLIQKMRQGAKLYDGNFLPTADTATPEFIEKLEKLAQQGGARDIRYIKVPRNAIFAEKGLPYQYAIIFTVEMDQGNMSTAPSFDAFLEVAKGYKRMAFISHKVAVLMRKNGFAAYPGTALGGITDYTYLGELAGLGAIGYHGLLITPEEGARVRINTIYTNIKNLPIDEKNENEHLWVRDFCAMCKKCIRKCPVDAIFNQPVPRGDGGMQTINHASCRDYFNQYQGCAICLAVCPFSQSGYAKIKASFKGNPNAPQFQITLVE
jgi:formate hydrogenlyase subunit 6/NADH:ubiquinone oxidoreductase subunit I